MAPGGGPGPGLLSYDLCKEEIVDDEESTGVNYFDNLINPSAFSELSLSPFPYIPISPYNSSAPTWFPTLSDENGCYNKRQKSITINPETIGTNIPLYSSIGSDSFRRLQIRDHIWAYSQRYLAAEELEEEAAAAAAAMVGSEDGNSEEEGEEAGGSGDGMKLVQLLISCAEAVACRDRSHASALLSELRSSALVFGSSFQRVASCFVQGLADRLALVQPLGTVGFVEPPAMRIDYSNLVNKEEALTLVYEICPHIRFGHFVANSAILEAFEGETFVHVVDLGMSLGLSHGHQWRQLIQALSNRPGQQPQIRLLRITAVGLCVDKFRVIGYELEIYAQSLGINLDFHVVESNLENLNIADIKPRAGEALVVNSILQLHCVVKESRGALNSVLQIVHNLSPKVLVLIEQDSSHNGPFFLGRFMEALHYYAAIFDSLDAMLPKYDTRRAKIEQFFFAEEIKNIVSCEGPARVERHERVDQWRRRMSRAGFQPSPIRVLAQAKQWLGKINVCEGYTIVEEKGCLVLGWKSKPIVAASCWKC